jgi:hypothetical protein
MDSATVVVHASRSEAGGAAVAWWTARRATSLREQAIEVVGRSIDAGARAGGCDRRAAIDRFMKDATREARRSPLTLVSSEVLGDLVAERDHEMLAALAELSRDVSVRVVAYVAPQHEALEAAWCSRGFLDPAPPSAWLRAREHWFDYLETVSALDEVAPAVDVALVPRTPTTLDGRPVVADFLARVLGWDTVPDDADDRRAQRVLPLELVNLLRERSSTDAGTPLDRELLAHITRSWEIPESPSVAHSRQILRSYAAARYGKSNRLLAERLRWSEDELTPCGEPSGVDATAPALDELDVLWRPQCDPVECDLILRAVDHMSALATYRRPPPRQSVIVERLRASNAPGAGLLRAAGRRGRAVLIRSRRVAVRPVQRLIARVHAMRGDTRERPGQPKASA